MTRFLVPLIKLALVAGIVGFVLSNIDWSDRLLVRDTEGTLLRELVGRVEGRWDDPDEIRFRPEGAATGERPATISFRPGRQPDPDDPTRTVVISTTPGLPSFIATLQPLPFALGALCYLLSLMVSALRWCWLLRAGSLEVSPWQAIRLTWIGLFFTNIVPGQTGGDVAKVAYVMHRFPDGRSGALVSVLVDRVLGLASLVLLASVVVLFALDRFSEIAMAIAACAAGLCLVGWLALGDRKRSQAITESVARRLPAFAAKLLRSLSDAFTSYHSHRRGLLTWLFAGAANHVVSIGSVVFIGNALGVGLPGSGVPLFEYYVLVPIINIVSAIPIGPNGWGVGEAAFAYLFGTYAASSLDVADPAELMRTQAVALSILFRLQITAWSIVGGAMVLLGRNRAGNPDLAPTREA